MKEQLTVHVAEHVIQARDAFIDMKNKGNQQELAVVNKTGMGLRFFREKEGYIDYHRFVPLLNIESRLRGCRVDHVLLIPPLTKNNIPKEVLAFLHSLRRIA